MVTYSVKASRISRPVTISTTTTISPPTLLWSSTNGDSHIVSLNVEFSSFLKLFIGQCQATNESTQTQASSNQSAFWRMESSIVQFETRWTSHLDSVGGEHYLFFPPVYLSTSNIIIITLEGLRWKTHCSFNCHARSCIRSVNFWLAKKSGWEWSGNWTKKGI